MMMANDNGPFDCLPVVPCKLADAEHINEFLSNIYASYPELSGSALWQDILAFAAHRLDEVASWHEERYID